MKTPYGKKLEAVPEPRQSGEVLKAKLLIDKPALVEDILSGDFFAKHPVANDIEEELKEKSLDLSMAVDVPVITSELTLFQRLVNWLKGDKGYKHLLCLQKMALTKRKMQQMLEGALKECDKEEAIILKSAAGSYDGLWKYLQKNFQGRGINLGDLVVWEEFDLALDENSSGRGLAKFPGAKQVDVLLQAYRNDRDVMRLLFSKVVKHEFTKLGILAGSDYLRKLKHPLKYIIMSQLAPRRIEVISFALNILAALPKHYELNHVRTFGIFQFAEFGQTTEIDEKIINQAMQAGRENERRVAR